MTRGELLYALITRGIGFRQRKVVLTFQGKSDPWTLAAWVVITIITLFLCISIAIPPVIAGPPFRTDDPEPDEYEHWAIHLASQYAKDKDGVSSTTPHFDIDYGVLPNVELHLLVPFGYDRPPGGPTLYGFGDVELGVKYRFIQETDHRPVVGTAPMVHLPSGSKARGLGNGKAQLFLPLWLQKTRGPWQTYGGGGYWINPGTDNKNYWFFGWQVQLEVAKWLTVGTEIFYQTPPVRYGNHETGYTVGAVINFTETHQVLCSAGSDIRGHNLFSYYLAFQWTWGPEQRNK